MSSTCTYIKALLLVPAECDREEKVKRNETQYFFWKELQYYGL